MLKFLHGTINSNKEPFNFKSVPKEMKTIWKKYNKKNHVQPREINILVGY